MEEATVFQALADATRLEILRLLAAGPSNVTGIVERLKVAQPAVSRHLRILREASLVRGERRGKEIEYSVRADEVRSAAAYLEGLMASAPLEPPGAAAGRAEAGVGASGRRVWAGSGARAGCRKGAMGAGGRGAGAGGKRVRTGKPADSRPAKDFVAKEEEYTVERKPERERKDIDDFLL
jgi:DNA-binding transcriptional ArsR family regulator